MNRAARLAALENPNGGDDRFIFQWWNTDPGDSYAATWETLRHIRGTPLLVMYPGIDDEEWAAFQAAKPEDME